MTFSAIFAVSIGAIIGALIRYFLGIWIFERWGGGLLDGALAANILGSLIAGFFIVVVAEKMSLPDFYRLLVIVGLCGSLTTFSAFSLAVFEFLESREYFSAMIHIAAHTGFSLLAVFLGVWLARVLV